MKKLSVLFMLALFHALTLWSANFKATTVEGVEMYFTIISSANNTCYVGLAWDEACIPTSYSGPVTIPETANGYKVIRIGSNAFKGCTEITSVVVPEGVTNLGIYAFKGCKKLNSVVLPSSLTHIYDRAFESCHALTTIDVPVSVKEISEHAFDGCNSLSSVTLHEGLQKLGGWAFSGCKSLQTVSLPSTLSQINGHTFDSSGLTSISLPEGVKSIGEYVFQNCSYLDRIVLPESVSSIDYDGMFTNCLNLRDVVIKRQAPPTASACTGGPFDSRYADNVTLFVPKGCRELYKVDRNWGMAGRIIEGSENYPNISFADEEVKRICTDWWDTDYDGELSFDEAAAVTTLRGRFQANEQIRSFDELQYFTGLTSLAEEEFANCGNLTNIALPTSLTSIGERAFSCCSNLESIVIPSAVRVIENQTFEGCSRLSSISMPETITRIGGGAFMDCRSLESIRLPESLTSMSDAFVFCTSLKSITIPKAVRYVTAFRGCSSLESISVEAGNPFLDSRNNCNAVIETSSNRLLAGCSNTVIPNDVVAIAQMAFAGISNVKDLDIPDCVYEIGFDAFQDTQWYASQPDGLVYAGKVAYRYKGQIEKGTDIVLRSDTKGIAEYAFEDDNCFGPKSITVPQSVVYIGPFAFWQCWGMENLYLEMREPPKVTESIADKPSNTTLYVPKGCKEVYSAVYPWKDFKEIVEMEPKVTEKCATPTIAYDHGELVFACETEGITFASEVTTSSAKGSEGERIKLDAPAYTITVVAKKEGYDDSEAATATIQWGDGRPVFTGFASVAIDTNGYSDVNGDGTVDVADIATIISEMAAQARKQGNTDM